MAKRPLLQQIIGLNGKDQKLDNFIYIIDIHTIWSQFWFAPFLKSIITGKLSYDSEYSYQNKILNFLFKICFEENNSFTKKIESLK